MSQDQTTDLLTRLRDYDSREHPDNVRADAAAKIERLRAALNEIVTLPEAPCLQVGGYGEGYNAARGTAADIALAALEAGK